MAFRGVMVGLLVEGVALNGFPFVLGVLACGGGLAWLLEGIE